MKKSFMFVAVAAAGMLASCSSESLTAGSDPKIEPTQEELVPIELNFSTPIARTGVTRGTGTVGGVVKDDGSGTETYVAANNDGTTAGAAANSWSGQKINVYMFNHGTLNVAQFKTVDIFNNALMKAPITGATGRAHLPEVDGIYIGTSTTAITDGGTEIPTIGGNAVTPAANDVVTYSPDDFKWDGTKWTRIRNLEKYYPLTGTYDFWGYRIDDATPTAAPAKVGDIMQVEITVDGTQDVLGAKTTSPDLSGTDPVLTTADIYSAKAARQNIQPELEFKHLMTRLTFEAYPGNDNAKTVYVYGVKVRSLASYDDTGASAPVYNTPTGKLDIAGTEAGFAQKITWTTSTAAPTQFVLKKRASGDANLKLVDLYNSSDADWTTNGAVSMNVSASNDPTKKVAIGEAIIAPDAKAYELEILLAQKVAKYEDSTTDPTDPNYATDWDEYKFGYVKTVVSAGATNFQPGNSYDFIFKVYGLEKIEVNTVLKPWIWGASVNVTTE